MVLLISFLLGLTVNVVIHQRKLDRIEFGEARLASSITESYRRGWRRLAMEYDDARAADAQRSLRLALAMGLIASFLVVGLLRSDGAAAEAGPMVMVYQLSLAVIINLSIVMVQEATSRRWREAFIITCGVLALCGIAVGLRILTLAP